MCLSWEQKRFNVCHCAQRKLFGKSNAAYVNMLVSFFARYLFRLSCAAHNLVRCLLAVFDRCDSILHDICAEESMRGRDIGVVTAVRCDAIFRFVRHLRKHVSLSLSEGHAHRPRWLRCEKRQIRHARPGMFSLRAFHYSITSHSCFFFFFSRKNFRYETMRTP